MAEKSYKTKIHNITSFPFPKIFDKMSTIDSREHSYVSNFFMTFDIETTSINTEEYHDSFMYIWQACINHEVIMGRTWTEFRMFLDEIKRYLGYRTLVVYCHNLSFEFQFLRTLVNVNEVFATEPRKILRALIEDKFEFRCSYRLTNMGLEKFLNQSKTVPEEFKKGQNFDYSKIRTPRTPLTKEEEKYCRNDVLGLYIALEELMHEEGDTLSSIPMTSTGYVRREARECMLSKSWNKVTIDSITPDARTYNMCKEASRGGNCHCNPIYSNFIIADMKSKDMSSAYPAVMMQEKFPMTKFLSCADDIYNLNPKKAYLIELEIYNIQLSTVDTIPYISFAKCKHALEAKKDNGRVIEAKYLHLFITDIDFHIIQSQYEWEAIDVVEMLSADYDYLPNEYRAYIFDRYIRKCDLKFGDKYYYDKEKNKINALFGMMLTDIVHPTIVYSNSEKPYVKDTPDLHEALNKVKHSRNNFLAYQWGIWVTAHCRNRLQKAIDACRTNGIPPVYCDTDSVKCIVYPDMATKFEEIFDKLNAEILEATMASGFDTQYVTHNVTFNLGLWEDDGDFKFFKSLGAKKYYIETVDGRQSITVSGLSKAKGLEYLQKHGGMKAFKPGTTIPANYSGRTAAHYKDVLHPRTLSIYDPSIDEEVLIETGSGMAIENVTYKFSISDDYEDFLAEIEDLRGKPFY